MATVNINASWDTVSKYFMSTAETWAGARDATTGSIEFGKQIEADYEASVSEPDYMVCRLPLWFDTSVIPAGATINSVKLNIHVDSIPSEVTNLSVQKGTFDTTLVISGYNDFTGNFYVNGATVALQYNEYEFNAQGIADIVLDGMTKLMVREYDHDYLNSEIVTDVSYYQVYFDEEINPPYLVIDYTEAVDTTPPTIALLGDAFVTLTVGDVYVDAGATATDDVDGDITDHIVVTNAVNTAVAGVYFVFYDVSDAALNPAAQTSRSVTVNPPIVAIRKKNPMKIFILTKK